VLTARRAQDSQACRETFRVINVVPIPKGEGSLSFEGADQGDEDEGCQGDQQIREGVCEPRRPRRRMSRAPWIFGGGPGVMVRR